ncbi:MAG: phosphatidylglycerophosphatase A [Bacteroidaceae bacterium]|nr:phosphatidylglycerophosphatase A [Bacteroidaceae bacterium]
MPLYHQLIATSLGVGFFPYGPGTMGAIFAIIVWLVLAALVSTPYLIAVTLALVVVFTLLGAWSSSVSERYWGEDPSRVVIDEVVGQWIVLLAMPGDFQWWHVLIALALFRFFDIVKPLGVRAMEKLKGGWGIMADDVLAGVYGFIVLHLLRIVL